MAKFIVGTGLFIAAGTALVAVLTWSVDDGGSPHSARGSRGPPEVKLFVNDARVSLERARELIRECRVHQTQSFHSGVSRLELKDGMWVRIEDPDEQAIYAEANKAGPGCGPKIMSME